nr:MAG TPA: L-seryl-tRNA(Sec) kinase [Bacteriophage sp.]
MSVEKLSLKRNVLKQIQKLFYLNSLFVNHHIHHRSQSDSNKSNKLT